MAKAIRKGRIRRRFVAVTCHYDVLEWLEPDWIADMASGRLARGRLRRPEIRLDVAPVHRALWDLFRRHHYLNTSLHKSSRCFVAFWGDRPVAFSAWLQFTRTGARGWKREHRTVVLPDYQGVGIGNRLADFCASLWTGAGCRAFSCTSHPSMIAYRSRSAHWHRCRLGHVAAPGTAHRISRLSVSRRRITGGFEYLGPPADPDLARRLTREAARIATAYQ